MNRFLAFICYPSRAGIVVFLTFFSLLSIVALSVRADIRADIDRIDAAISHLITAAPRHPMRDSTKRRQMASDLARAADRHDIPWEVLTAMAHHESSVRVGTVGPAGEIGPIQVHPATARRYRCDTSSSASLIDCGAKILSDLRSQCGGRLAGGLAAYCSSTANCNPKPGSKLRRAVGMRLRLARKLRSLSDE